MQQRASRRAPVLLPGCLSNLLDHIQDHYTFSQPGLQRMVFHLKELVTRIDAPLAAHLEAEGVEFMHFVSAAPCAALRARSRSGADAAAVAQAFRWMNCLLLRELPLRLVVRLWDSCLCEEAGFEDFHVYVCVALLERFSEKLRSSSFQELVMGLQSLPTDTWTNDDVEALLSQA